MADKNEKASHLRLIGLIAYAAATALGFFYGTAYYGYFGISLLDYASPIDLLFIGLANLKYLWAALIGPFLFLCSLLFGSVSVIPLLMLLVALAVALSWVVLSVCVSFVVALTFAIALVQAIALRAYWLWAALATIRATRLGKRDPSPPNTDQGVPKTIDRPVRLPTAYRQQTQHAPAWKAINPQTFLDFTNASLLASFPRVTRWGKDLQTDILEIIPKTLKGIKKAYWSFERVFGVVRSERRTRFKPWAAIEWLHKLVLIVLAISFLMYLIFATSQLGIIDAEDVRRKAQTSKGCTNPADCGSIGLWEAAITLLPLPGGLPLGSVAPEGSKVFVIPTGNVASLDFSDCLAKDTANGSAEDEERNRLGRVNFRQDAGGDSRYGIPECLLRLGGIGSWQFLAQIPGSYGRKEHKYKPERIQPRAPDVPSVVVVFDGRSGAVSTPTCDLQLAALVGPFPTGSGKLAGEGDSSKSNRSTDETGEDLLCKVPGDQEDRRVEPVGINAASDLIGSSSEMIVLVGRADIRPIHNDDFKSNMELATKRVNWVSEEIESLNRSLGVLSIPGGSADSEPHDNPCSRVVEIYTCPAD